MDSMQKIFFGGFVDARWTQLLLYCYQIFIDSPWIQVRDPEQGLVSVINRNRNNRNLPSE